MDAAPLRNEGPDLAVLESAEVFVPVDNVSDGLSSVPDGVTSELTNLVAAGAEELSGDDLCFACLGISLVVAGRIGDRVRTILFDGGPTGYAVDHNAPRLGGCHRGGGALTRAYRPRRRPPPFVLNERTAPNRCDVAAPSRCLTLR